MKKALEGVRVIDMSHVLAAPTATMFLADLGAEVIHLEPPKATTRGNTAPSPGSRARTAAAISSA